MAKIYLGLGSNVGNRARNIYTALRRLQDEIQLDRISSLYETQPVGYSHQAWFLNLVCAAETRLSPEDLLSLAKRIEREMGRKQGIRFGPRIVDIDILFYEDLIMDMPQLEIPHPRLAERGFVLIPLNEIAPNLPHPRLKARVRELLDNSEFPHQVRLYRLMDRQASD
jgi:2-amino-4-hydroxy-6-hydroxymethyldihydropteridine diphosphokinase